MIIGVLFIQFKTPPIKSDARGYHNIGIELSKEDFIDILKYEPQRREPVYPIFLAICFKIFGKHRFDLIHVFSLNLADLLSFKSRKIFYYKVYPS